MRLFFILLLCIFPSTSSYAGDFVSTMEAVQDIPLGPSKEDNFHGDKDPSATIKKGERFYSFYTCQPEVDNGVNYGCLNDDDRCVIRYHGKNYDSTCVWLIDGWMRNPHDSDPFRFIKTLPANSANMKLDN